jgi:hypothetical protein
LKVLVLFPTPPFRFAIAITVAIFFSSYLQWYG